MTVRGKRQADPGVLQEQSAARILVIADLRSIYSSFPD